MRRGRGEEGGGVLARLRREDVSEQGLVFIMSHNEEDPPVC